MALKRYLPEEDAEWERQNPRTQSSGSRGAGFVYFIQAEHGGPVKIGWTTDLDKRLGDLQMGCPYKLVCRRVVEADFAEERRLHQLFAEHRLHGEWFAPAAGICAVGDVLPDSPINIETAREKRKPQPKKQRKPRKPQPETDAQRYARLMEEQGAEWFPKLKAQRWSAYSVKRVMDDRS